MAEELETPNPAVNRWPMVLVVGGSFVLMLYLLEPILFPFVLGGLIGYFGDPLVDALERRKVNRTLGVAVVFFIIVALMLVAMVFAVPVLLEQIDLLIKKIPLIYQWLTDQAVPWIQQRLSLPASKLPQVDWSGQLADNWQSLGKVTANTVRKITGSGVSVLAWMANLALVPVVAFYLMRDWDVLMKKSLSMFPLAWQDQVAELVREGDEVVGAFLRGQFVVMCALGAIYGFGLWLVGLQLALLLGVIAGLASIVPYLGFMVGFTASAITAYAQFHDWTMLLWVGLVFGVGQIVESMLLTPVLVGDRIGLHPVAVIFALMAGAQIGGFVGVVIALPVAAVIMVFIRHGLQHYRASELYSGE